MRYNRRNLDYVPAMISDLKKLTFLVPVVLILIVVIIVVLVFSQSVPDSGKLRVLAAENFYGDIASQIGGTAVQTQSILSDPNIDPHAYELTSKDRQAINAAQLIIYNGIGYDSFMDKAVPKESDSVKVMNVGTTLHIPKDANPHIWYNITSVEDIAMQMKNELESISPANKDTFEKNYLAFSKGLHDVTTSCAAIRGTHPEARIVATERVADYLLYSCGMFDYTSASCTFVEEDSFTPALKTENEDFKSACTLVPQVDAFKKAVEEGIDPSAASVAAMQNLIKNRDISVLIYNSQAIDKVTQQLQDLAKANNVSVVSVSETMPQNATYQSWMIDELKKIKSALDKG